MNTAILAAKIAVSIFLAYFGAEKLRLCWRNNGGGMLFGQAALAAVALGLAAVLVAQLVGLVAS